MYLKRKKIAIKNLRKIVDFLSTKTRIFKKNLC